MSSPFPGMEAGPCSLFGKSEGGKPLSPNPAPNAWKDLSVTPWNPSLRRPFSWPHHFSPLPFRGHGPWPSPESHHPPPPSSPARWGGADLQICSCSPPSPPTPFSREPLLVALGMGRAVDTAILGARDSGPQAGAHACMTGASGWRTWVKEIGVTPRSLSPIPGRGVVLSLS